MTELSFLVELLLNHKLPKVTRDLVANRIKEVEGALSPKMAVTAGGGINVRDINPFSSSQAPSTLALMAKHGIEPPPVQIEQIAKTPAAAAALNSRQEAINEALSGKPAKGQTSPRKF